jgi:hypothetical protein
VVIAVSLSVAQVRPIAHCSLRLNDNLRSGPIVFGRMRLNAKQV